MIFVYTYCYLQPKMSTKYNKHKPNDRYHNFLQILKDHKGRVQMPLTLYMPMAAMQPC